MISLICFGASGILAFFAGCSAAALVERVRADEPACSYLIRGLIFAAGAGVALWAGLNS